MENNIQQVIFCSAETSAKNEFQSIIAQKGQLLSKKIEMGMKQKQYNRQQFANMMGVQPSIITRWLSGNHNFTVQTLFEIEEQLDIQLIAVDRPVNKQISLYMVVGSEPTQHLHSSLVDALSDMVPQHITYCVGSNANTIDDYNISPSLIEIKNLQNK